MCRCFVAAALLALPCVAIEPVTLIDFAKEGHGWRGNPRTREAPQRGGFSVELTGAEDPWLEGPAVAVPSFGEAQKLALTLEAESSQAGAFEVFYAPAGKGFSAEMSAWLRKPSPSATAYQGIVPVVADQMRFRLDPPGSEGRVTLRTLRAAPLIPRAAPALGRPARVALPEKATRVGGGRLQVILDPARWNAFACLVDGTIMAESNPAEQLAYLEGGKVVPVLFSAAGRTPENVPDGVAVMATARDLGGAVWQMSRRFVADKGGVRIETSLTVDQAREVIHLPWLTLFAGAGTFGEAKCQALLPGVEYLENEPSSNEKEIRGVAANRRIVAGYKVCYPLMALSALDRWFSVTWLPGTVPVSPVFDSPDRVFQSGGHVMGIWSPAVGEARFENELVVYGGVRLDAHKTYTCSATVCGGKGAAVTEAVKDYVARSGLPGLPRFAGGIDDAINLLAAGWLDSAARQGTLWRHAVWGDSFPPARAEDVPAYLLWLAANGADPVMNARLRETARAAITNLPAGCYGVAGISHVKRPTGALLYGHLEGLVKQAGPHASQIAKRLASGRARYTPGKVDYASTLGSDHCNGYTAMSAEEMLLNASLTGDEASLAASLAALDQMTLNYAGQVPRGAQPWEMPLHTPDIVAAARLVRCYVLGYLLSGKAEHLEQARYWAWTGVTMIYLAPPTSGAIGLYATIGVIGATNWQAPNWVGQPVQWCGLVYRSALEDLARADAAQRDVWRTLARGMTIAGLQMCFPLDDAKGRGGLLPDYFLLQPQVSDGPAINPGTLQAHLAEAYDKTPMYTVTRLDSGSLVHVPGEVKQAKGAADALKLTVSAWPQEAYRVLITRAGRAPSAVRWNGQAVTPQYLSDARVIIVPLTGSGTLDVEL